MTLGLHPTKLGIRDFNNPLDLSPSVVEEIRRAAVVEYPHEVCGLIVSGKWVKAPNIAKDTLISWEIEPEFQAQFGPDDVQGVVHSHCKPYKGEPTKHDMEAQIPSGLPWGIVHTDKEWATKPQWWGDFRLDEPLVGRPFIHGISDCYSAIRSWYWQKREILLPEYPRNTDWWEQNGGVEDMYTKGIGAVGTRISRDQIQPGDVALFKFSYPVPSHAAVITDNGQMYHHIAGHLSGETPLGKYQKFAVAWYTYRKDI